MAKIIEDYNFGNNEELTQEELLDLMSKMYTDLAVAINKKPDVYQRDTNGLVTDTKLANGDINLNTSTGNIEFLTAHPTQESVTWSGSGGLGNIIGYATVGSSGNLLKGSGLTSSKYTTGKFKLTFTSPQSTAYYSVIATPAVYDANAVYSITTGVKTHEYFDIKIKALHNVWEDGNAFSVVVIG